MDPGKNVLFLIVFSMIKLVSQVDIRSFTIMLYYTVDGSDYPTKLQKRSKGGEKWLDINVDVNMSMTQKKEMKRRVSLQVLLLPICRIPGYARCVA